MVRLVFLFIGQPNCDRVPNDMNWVYSGRSTCPTPETSNEIYTQTCTNATVHLYVSLYLLPKELKQSHIAR